MLVTLAVLLYLIPVVALVLARARHERELWEVALDIPSAVAGDLLVVFLLSRVLPLEQAALASRPIAVAAAAAWLVRRRRRGDTWGWPRALTPSAVATTLAAGAAATALSLTLSRPYHIWDRFWHISLVTSIRGQRLPFSNAYDPTERLSYHYSGDALAAMLQSFSSGSLHSSHALSVAHDLMFFFSGVTLALLLLAWGARGLSPIVLGVVAWLLTGPTSLARDDGKHIGYSFTNYISLSFRPHASLGGLLVLGFVGALLVRVRLARRAESAPPLWATTVPLVLTMAVLSITDEASAGLLGLTVGAGWLIWPEILSPSRQRGFAVLVGLLLSIFVANFVCAGLLAPGSASPPVRLVPWRAPGFATATLPFSGPNGVKMFLVDVVGLLIFALAAVLAALRGRTRPLAATSALVVVVTGLGLVALGRFDIPPRAVEAHRFVTAAMLVCPIIGLFWLHQREEIWQPVRSPLVQSLLILALTLPAISTFAWLRSPGAAGFASTSSFSTKENFYETDCRAELGARLGEEPVPTYISHPIFYIYTGCHPAYVAGAAGAGHKIKMSAPLQSFDALADLDRSSVVQGKPLAAVCPEHDVTDPICANALAAGQCAPVGRTQLGTGIVRCMLSPENRAALLASRPPKK
jgi:hypothetical protein